MLGASPAGHATALGLEDGGVVRFVAPTEDPRTASWGSTSSRPRGAPAGAEQVDVGGVRFTLVGSAGPRRPASGTRAVP